MSLPPRAATVSPKSRESTSARASTKAPRAAVKRRRKRGRASSTGRSRPRVRREGTPPLDRTRLDELTQSPVPVPRAGRELPSRRLLVPTRSLHIVMVGWEWPPSHSGGLGVHSYELCKELTKLGHRITFLTPFPGPFTPVDGVTFRFPGGPVGEAPAPFPPAYWAGATPDSPFWNAIDGYNTWVAELSGVEAVDVVHVHDWFGTVGAAALAQRLGRPLVMTVHSTEYDRSLGHPWQHILERERIGDRGGDPRDRREPAPPPAADRPVPRRRPESAGDLQRRASERAARADRPAPARGPLRRAARRDEGGRHVPPGRGAGSSRSSRTSCS